ncbi:hypothetical protein BC830DRAFT_677781 [Chytriomyces sp. MP71]|nr:hypothetical protein BC830DRAFT_677781 [Chytriomyces sp. MP71]
MCKTDNMFSNKQLEMKLQPFMKSCSNKNCQHKTLRWNMNKHLDECQFTKAKCPFCHINIFNLITFRTELFSKRDQPDDEFFSNSHILELDRLSNETVIISTMAWYC